MKGPAGGDVDPGEDEPLLCDSAIGDNANPFWLEITCTGGGCADAYG